MTKNQERALRYRKLALAEQDNEKAALLNRIADEAERGVLCTTDNRQDDSFQPPHSVDTGSNR